MTFNLGLKEEIPHPEDKGDESAFQQRERLLFGHESGGREAWEGQQRKVMELLSAHLEQQSDVVSYLGGHRLLWWLSDKVNL